MVPGKQNDIEKSHLNIFAEKINLWSCEVSFQEERKWNSKLRRSVWNLDLRLSRPSKDNEGPYAVIKTVFFDEHAYIFLQAYFNRITGFKIVGPSAAAHISSP